MLTAFLNGLAEGKRASALALNPRSKFLLRYDFIFSRLLKLCKWPGYNSLRTVSLRNGPVAYRFNRGDLQSLRELLIEEVYACDLPFSPTTVLDLGANIGLFSLWLSQRIRARQTQSNSVKPVYFLAVEALSSNAVVAKQNFLANALLGEVIPEAVGQQSGWAWFNECAESNLGSLSINGCNGEHQRVPVIGIRQLIQRLPGGKADIVKMDIEGAEGELLSHDMDWLDRVRAMVVEWHDEVAPSAPLIENVIRAGFHHERINSSRQDNLSLFVKHS